MQLILGLQGRIPLNAIPIFPTRVRVVVVPNILLAHIFCVNTALDSFCYTKLGPQENFRAHIPRISTFVGVTNDGVFCFNGFEVLLNVQNKKKSKNSTYKENHANGVKFSWFQKQLKIFENCNKCSQKV